MNLIIFQIFEQPVLFFVRYRRASTLFRLQIFLVSSVVISRDARRAESLDTDYRV